MNTLKQSRAVVTDHTATLLSSGTSATVRNRVSRSRCYNTHLNARPKLLLGSVRTHLKRERGLDVIVPLRCDMSSYEEAVKLAELAGQWQRHPSRPARQIAFVAEMEHVWNECDAALNACVIRFFNEKKRVLEYIVLVTTDLGLSAE